MRALALMLLLAAPVNAASAFRPAAPSATASCDDIARASLASGATGLPGALAGELVHVSTTSGRGGVHFVTFEQRAGLPVAGSRTTVAVDAAGNVIARRLGTLAAFPPAAMPAAPARPASDLVRSLGLTGAGGRPLRAGDEPPALVLVAIDGRAEPALRVHAWPEGEPSALERLDVSAIDGRLLRRESLHFDAVDSVRAWPLDPTAPSVLVPLPDPATRPSVHSPLGWADDVETSGNNVLAVLDRAGARDVAGPRAVATGVPPALDFAFTGSPADDADAALANVFWALNDAHDRFRALGFDEPSGAMQQDGYGRGGVGGDRVIAFVQSGSVDGRTPTNTVRLAVGADGTETTLTVGLFQVPTSGQIRDAAFETDLLYHEYAHGVLARMLGDAACFNNHHPRGLSEGWADFFAASFTGDPVIGAWTRDDPVRGHRSSSLEDNAYSLANFCLDGCNPNRNGEIWAGLLWDVRRLLMTRLGARPGAEAAEQLAFEAIRYLPCTPTFLDARDALLLAERAMFGGAYHCDIWQLLLMRGMGADATTSGPGDTLPQAGYALPPQCSGSATIELDAAEYGLAGTVAITVLDAAPPPSPVVRVTTTGGDAETLALDVTLPWLLASVPLATGTPAPGDGALQVADGDTITATYDARGIDATAGVSGDAATATVLHLVLASPCGDDDRAAAPAFFFLPGFLDAGETASILIASWTGSLGPLVDATVEVESLNPHVSIAPAGPIPLGTVVAAPPGGTTLMVFTVTAAATTDVVPGETAELVLRYRALGRSSENRYVITLSKDYVLESGLSPFTGGIETFEAGSPTAALWTHAAHAPGPDAWRLEACAGDASPAGYANASAGCASYPDGQGAPSLVSPVLVPPLPDAVAWRITDLAWRHQVELYSDPTRAGCERDVVAAFLTTDPDALPYGDPLGVVRGEAGALRVLTSDQNTTGFADGTPATAVTAPVYGQPGDVTGGQRLAWVFFSDATDPAAPACVPRVNDGRYFLDNVIFRYEYVREVDEAAPCAGECRVLASAVTLPGAPFCPGDPFEIDASGSSIAGCSDAPRFSFTGPGVPPAYADTALDRAPATFDPAGSWDVTVTCAAGPACSATLTLTPDDARSTARGGTPLAPLTVRRRGDDIQLAWRAAADPQRHGAWRASTRTQLESPVTSWDLVGRADAEGLHGDVLVAIPGAALEPGLACYLVGPRDPCTDAPR